MDKVRVFISHRAVDKGLSLSELSKKLGKSHAYMQQFIKRGVPAELPEAVRIKLAEILDVDEAQLGAPSREPRRVPAGEEFEPDPDPDEVPAVSRMGRHLIKAGALPEFDLRAGASYGGGYALPALVSDGKRSYDAHIVKAEWVIPPSFLEGELRLTPVNTDVLPVDGPSMLPDLAPGDRVLIDRTHRDPRQGGIFAVREGDGIIIKHVELERGSDPPRIICSSSNPTYKPFPLILDGEQVEIIGRVAGRISRM